MKILLDECLPRRLVRDFPEHAITTVPKQGWAGITNGALMAKAEPEFDVFITMDSNLAYQQNAQQRRLCVIILHGINSRYETLEPLLPMIRRDMERAAPGAVFHVHQG